MNDEPRVCTSQLTAVDDLIGKPAGDTAVIEKIRWIIAEARTHLDEISGHLAEGQTEIDLRTCLFCGEALCIPHRVTCDADPCRCEDDFTADDYLHPDCPPRP